MNEYTFDIPAIITVQILHETTGEARAKAAAIDSIEQQVGLSNADYAGRDDPQLTNGDVITVIAAHGKPHLVRGYGPITCNPDAPRSIGDDLGVQPDAILDLDKLIRRGREVTDSAANIKGMLERWEKATGDDGNDDEHDVGAEMAEMLELLITDAWVVRYSWPIDDANPSGATRVHMNVMPSQSPAEAAATTWRKLQAGLGLTVDAEAFRR